MHEVSVLMPVYNAMPYLPEAVESIRAQTMRDWRMVIVDDGSTDDTVAYLENLNEPRIEVFRQPNAGPAAAANFGLAQIESPFVMRIDADDVALPTRMAEQLAFLRNNPHVGLVGSQIRMLGSRRQGPVSTLATDHHTIYNDLIHGRHAICNPAIMCRTELLKEIGGYDTQSDQDDWHMCLRMGEVAELANLDRPLLLYRVHAGSLNISTLGQLRLGIAFACERARRRRDGRPPIAYDEFLAQRRSAPLWRRGLAALDDYALAQYRNAMVEILGDAPLRGRLRLAISAAASPRRTVNRIGRTLRKHLPSPARNDEAKQLLPSPASGRGAGGEGALRKTPFPPSPDQPPSEGPIAWPRKYDLFGVGVSVTTYNEAIALILESGRRREPAVASLHAVHAVVTASDDEPLRRQVNTFEIVAPDGQPVRWALNWLYGTALAERVYGPELMLRLCGEAAKRQVPVFLCGGSPEVAEALPRVLLDRFPELQIAGSYSPPFRPLSPEEDQELVDQINRSGAGIVFIGLGCPKQDRFAFEHRDRIRGAQVCVGAAFDFHAGVKRMAPPWMQRRGLEWLFRLSQEPSRLWRRYLITNTVFVFKLLAARLRRRRPGQRPAPAT